MSNTALAIYEDGGFEIMQRSAKAMAASGFFADARDAAQAMVKVMAGAELGLPPFASMTGIHIIKGKPTLGANLLAALIKRSGRYGYRVTALDDSACRIVFYEGGEAIGESTFTVQDAQRAGVQNMGKYPRNMLFARAISNGARWHCPDVFSGAPIYTAEELGAPVDDDGDVVYSTYTEAPVQVQAPQVQDTRPWYERTTSDPRHFLTLVMDNVPRYAGNKQQATNAIKLLLDGSQYADLDADERTALAKDIDYYASLRDEDVEKENAVSEILRLRHQSNEEDFDADEALAFVD